MSREAHVRFCEHLGGRFPGVTRPMAESFFATLECELIDRSRFQNPDEARQAVFTFLEGWYNPHRRHSAIGYVSPIQYEKQHAQATAAPKPETVH